MSAHADQVEILAWLKEFEKPPKFVYITHGEPEAALALKQEIVRTLGWQCIIPSYLDKIELK